MFLSILMNGLDVQIFCCVDNCRISQKKVMQVEKFCRWQKNFFKCSIHFIFPAKKDQHLNEILIRNLQHITFSVCEAEKKLLNSRNLVKNQRLHKTKCSNWCYISAYNSLCMFPCMWAHNNSLMLSLKRLLLADACACILKLRNSFTLFFIYFVLFSFYYIK